MLQQLSFFLNLKGHSLNCDVLSSRGNCMSQAARDGPGLNWTQFRAHFTWSPVCEVQEVPPQPHLMSARLLHLFCPVWAEKAGGQRASEPWRPLGHGRLRGSQPDGVSCSQAGTLAPPSPPRRPHRPPPPRRPPVPPPVARITARPGSHPTVLAGVPASCLSKLLGLQPSTLFTRELN